MSLVCYNQPTISIHAPRGGSDGVTSPNFSKGKDFNPRSPRGERHHLSDDIAKLSQNFNPRSPRGERLISPLPATSSFVFQSTLPAGGATPVLRCLPRPASNFNPRSPRGERPLATRYDDSFIRISIHAPRGGSDLPERKPSPAGSISIHAPRGGSDSRNGRPGACVYDFNPRSPRGERHSWPFVRWSSHLYFNPRSPRGERQFVRIFQFKQFVISIHAPRGGSDPSKLGIQEQYQ